MAYLSQNWAILKIERKIKNVLKNNIYRFLIIIVLVFLSLFIFSLNCFASTSDLTFTFNDTSYTLLNFPFNDKPYIIYCESEGSAIQIRVYEGEMEEGKIYVGFLHYTGSRWESKFCSYEIDAEGNITNITNNLTFSNYIYEDGEYTKNFEGTWCSFNCGKDNTSVPNFVYYASPFAFVGASNGDVTAEHIENNVFFQVTPLLGVQVVEITQVEEIPKAIIQVMKTIIPVGLIILSIFLVIFLIRLVILRQM